MKNLVYLSTPRTIPNETVLADILSVARKNNVERNVTGVLLYSEGTFIQVLEGDEQDVDFIFGKIENDIRHKNLVLMMEREIDERNFPAWSMGFITIDKIKSEELLSGLTNTDDIIKSSSKDTSIAMLKAFIETNQLLVRH